RVGAAEAEAPRQLQDLVRVVGNALRLALADDLDLVLDVAQEAIRGGERVGFLARHVARRGQALEGGQRAACAQPRVLAAVHQLVRLHPELDAADAAASELDVALAGRRLSQRR